MKTSHDKTIKVNRPDQRAALASPLRLEILGLFTHGDSMSIAEIAQQMGRKPGSLYHHMGILERAGLMHRVGTRLKGKRHEALFCPTAGRFEVAAPADQEEAVTHAVKTMASAFRMTERDLEAALRDETGRQEGDDRNLFAGRIHLRASPEMLAAINEHVDAIMQLLQAKAAGPDEPSPDDEHLSLTIALLPIKGRGGSHKDG